MKCNKTAPEWVREKTVKIHHVAPEPDRIRQAAKAIERGGLVGFPTSRLYGIGADPFNPASIEKLFAAKGRPAHMPILLLIDTMERAVDLALEIPDTAQRLMKALWPGGITLVFRASSRVHPRLTGHTGKIGLRLPAHPVARALAQTVGGVVTGTSANLSGGPDPKSPEQMDPAILSHLDLVLDAGPLPGPPGSTVVDVTVFPPKILRKGTVPQQAVENALGIALG